MDDDELSDGRPDRGAQEVRHFARDEAAQAGSDFRSEFVLLGVLLACPEVVAGFGPGILDGAEARRAVAAAIATGPETASAVETIERHASEAARRRGLADALPSDLGRALLSIASASASRVLSGTAVTEAMLKEALSPPTGQSARGSDLPLDSTVEGRRSRAELLGVFSWIQAVKRFGRNDAPQSEGYVRGTLDAMYAHSVLSLREHRAWHWRYMNELAIPSAEGADTRQWPEPARGGIAAHLKRVLAFVEGAVPDAARTTGERAYVGGTLTAIGHLSLLQPEQWETWRERLDAALPPTAVVTMSISPLQAEPDE